MLVHRENMLNFSFAKAIAELSQESCHMQRFCTITNCAPWLLLEASESMQSGEESGYK
jgi:hypothetical protein